MRTVLTGLYRDPARSWLASIAVTIPGYFTMGFLLEIPSVIDETFTIVFPSLVAIRRAT